MNNAAKSGDELLREIDADRAKAYRHVYRLIAIFCAIPVGITAVLWLIAVLT